jgi:hypothetical protein
MNHHKKIVTKREGPFEIDQVLRPVTYQLKLPDSWKIHNVFHAALLRPFIENEIYGTIIQYHYSNCLKEKKCIKSKQSSNINEEEEDINITWKGYHITEATWENESAFSKDGNMIQQYKDQYQL